MPVIRVQHVSSFSSEDANHPAGNLLSSDTYRKWKCASAGEKQAVIVLQLETPAQIYSVDIGNEGSAFVEVLVGRSSAPDDYKVLLVASTFMSPPDSKAWNNTNRVRMFGSEKLSKGVAEQKWDRVKVVCTQPYNKKKQYGLAFITLHSPPGKFSGQQEGEVEGKKATPIKTHLGAFSLKNEPKTLPSGSLFYKKDPVLSPVASSSAAAQARSASTAALRGEDTRSPRRREVGGAGRHRGEGEGKTDKPVEKRKAVEDHSTRSSGPPSKKTKVSTASKTKDSTSDIMCGVVFSLSGFKNPFRGELREKAVEMGGVYQPDWSSTCTHLVCAFPNTPKFNQVKAKRGLIVMKEWVLDSYVKKKRLPASKYRLSGGSGASSSEDEFYDSTEKNLFRAAGGEAGRPGKTEAASKKTVGVSASREEDGSAAVTVKRGGEEGEKKAEDDLYGGSTDEGSDMETDVVVKKKPLPREPSSECDTEDEIERIKAGQENMYAGTTETESDSENEGDKPSVKSLASLPDLFSCSGFMLYGSFSPDDRRLVQRYITAYNGHVEDYMSEKISYVVTLEPWDANFDQALEDNSSLTFVRPQWVFKCHEKQSRVPHQPFAVVPS